MLKTHKVSTRTQALKLEKHLLKKFAQYKHVPKIALLSGGNSECFDNKSEVEILIAEEFLNLNKLWMQQEEQLKVKEQKNKRTAAVANAALSFSS